MTEPYPPKGWKREYVDSPLPNFIGKYILRQKDTEIGVIIFGDDPTEVIKLARVVSEANQTPGIPDIDENQLELDEPSSS